VGYPSQTYLDDIPAQDVNETEISQMFYTWAGFFVVEHNEEDKDCTDENAGEELHKSIEELRNDYEESIKVFHNETQYLEEKLWDLHHQPIWMKFSSDMKWKRRWGRLPKMCHQK